MHELPRGPRHARSSPEAAAGGCGYHLPALSLALIVGLSPVVASSAEIYRWTDDAGSVHFSDSLHSVPERYRKETQSRSSDLPPPPPVRPEKRVESRVTEIPLVKHETGYLVHARFNDRETAQLLLDTGASSTVVSPGFASRLGLDVRWRPPVVLKTAGGQVEVGWADVDNIEVGGRRIGPLRVVVHDALQEADGLLGMNFLGAFRVEIHSQGPSLVLTPP